MIDPATMRKGRTKAALWLVPLGLVVATGVHAQTAVDQREMTFDHTSQFQTQEESQAEHQRRAAARARIEAQHRQADDEAREKSDSDARAAALVDQINQATDMATRPRSMTPGVYIPPWAGGGPDGTVVGRSRSEDQSNPSSP